MRNLFFITFSETLLYKREMITHIKLKACKRELNRWLRVLNLSQVQFNFVCLFVSE